VLQRKSRKEKKQKNKNKTQHTKPNTQKNQTFRTVEKRKTEKLLEANTMKKIRSVLGDLVITGLS